MVYQDRQRSRFRQIVEGLLYTLAFAIPVLYFASRYPPFDAWLGRIAVRSPIVFEPPGTDAPVSGSAAARDQPSGPKTERVYRCAENGIVVLSDRPCGDVIETRDIAPGDINIVPAEMFTGRSAVPGNVDCEALAAGLRNKDVERRASRSEQDNARLAVERDALWQRGRDGRCW